MFKLGLYGRGRIMRKKRVVYLRGIYQTFLNKKREEIGEAIAYNKNDFRRIKRYWAKHKVIMP